MAKYNHMMKRGKIVPQANFQSLTPSIPNLSPSRMAIPTEIIPWSHTRPAALITSYGAAGSNSALILVSPTSKDRNRSQLVESKRLPLILSANSATSLHAYAATLASYLRKATADQDQTRPTLADVIYTLCRKRARHKFGVELQASNTAELIVELENLKNHQILELAQRRN